MLETFLRDLKRKPRRLGQFDCALVLADWWMLTHPGAPDPAAQFRGAYSTEEEAAALLAAHGHLPRLVARLARKAGAPRTREPLPGDIAVVRVEGWWGAILSPEGRWTVRAHHGVAASRDFRVAAAWRVGWAS